MARTHNDKAPKKPAAVRLREALDTLIHSDRGIRTRPDITITELCRQAGVSRNSLYRYHAPLLNELRTHQSRATRTRVKARQSAAQRRLEGLMLRDRIAKLAALVDHYYAAYRETAALLERREHEIAEMRRQSLPRLITIDSRPGT